MSKLNDKKKQANAAENAQAKKQAIKVMPKKDNVKSVASKSIVAKPSAAKAQKKPATKPKKHIVDKIKNLPSKRVWPD